MAPLNRRLEKGKPLPFGRRSATATAQSLQLNSREPDARLEISEARTVDIRELPRNVDSLFVDRLYQTRFFDFGCFVFMVTPLSFSACGSPVV